MNQLPEKIVDIDVLRINRNSNKRCQCTEKTFVIDPQNRAINCGRCGAPVDPYEAMYYLATEQEQLRDQVLNLLEQRKQIVNYKPHMLAFRDLERQSRGKKMLPTCPHCHRGFYFEELTRWINTELEKGWRKRGKEEANEQRY